MADLDRLYAQIQGDEGFKSTVYPDSRGYLTLAYGICVDKRVPGAGLSAAEGLYLLQGRVKNAVSSLAGLMPFWGQLNDCRQNVLLEMAFQMGVNGVMDFHDMRDCLARGDYDGAANAMLDSDWAENQSPARAARLAQQMRTGVFA